MAGGLSACPIFSNETAEVNERIMIDSMPAMAWRCRPHAFVEFFCRRWLVMYRLVLGSGVWIGWMIAVHADDLNRCEHLDTARSPRIDLLLRLFDLDGVHHEGW
jgi:hypothetical protein